MRLPQIAIACCRRTSESPHGDLYPDPDASPLQSALEVLGGSVRLVSWDDPTVNWARFDRIVVSSTWDSVDRPADYLAWTKLVGSLSTVVNPVPVLVWGLDKTHQRAFSDLGVPTIPTTWVEPEQPWSLPGEDFVVKPAISAGGRATARYSRKEAAAAAAHIEQLHADGQTVMIQPYLESIDKAGELDLVFVAGRFTHALRKRFPLPSGAAITERPWERLAHQELTTPSSAEQVLGATVVELSREMAGAAPVYCRVDIVGGPDGNPLLLEVEVVDPYLFLDKKPDAAARLAAAVLASG
jgi:hypothetical protein